MQQIVAQRIIYGLAKYQRTHRHEQEVAQPAQCQPADRRPEPQIAQQPSPHRQSQRRSQRETLRQQIAQQHYSQRIMPPQSQRHRPRAQPGQQHRQPKVGLQPAGRQQRRPQQRLPGEQHNAHHERKQATPAPTQQPPRRQHPGPGQQRRRVESHRRA